ncbi:hypothetical protein D3C75_1047620 [compost metagenome]
MVVPRIPKRMAPGTSSTIRMAIITKPMMVNWTVGFSRLPRWKIVSKESRSVYLPFSTLFRVSTPTVSRPLFFRPMMVMNRPIPTVMACFRLSGMATISICRTLVTVRMMKMMPEINTAVRPICQVNGLSVAAEDSTTEAK